MFTLMQQARGVALGGSMVLCLTLAATAQDGKNKDPGKGIAGGFNQPKPGGFHAVVRPGGGGPANPYSALLNNPYGVGTMSSSMGGSGDSGYGGYGGYNYIYPDPFGGYLKGAADVINAQGQYLIMNQQAYLLREQVRRAQMENKRALFDEWLYRQANTPTLEDERERILREELRRSLNDPPSPEIWSGKTLNVLLASAQKNLAASAGKSANLNLPVDEDILKKINVTSGKNGSNIGVFKNQGVLTWPLALRDLPAAAEMRQQLDVLAKKAYDDAIKGQTDTGTLNEMTALSRKLQQVLAKNVGELPFSQYNAAKRFLSQLDDGIKALSQPDAANYVNGRYALRGRTIGEVVQHMTENGLVFAPATAGEESAYKAMQFALSAYERAVHDAVTQR